MLVTVVRLLQQQEEYSETAKKFRSWKGNSSYPGSMPLLKQQQNVFFIIISISVNILAISWIAHRTLLPSRRPLFCQWYIIMDPTSKAFFFLTK